MNSENRIINRSGPRRLLNNPVRQAICTNSSDSPYLVNHVFSILFYGHQLNDSYSDQKRLLVGAALYCSVSSSRKLGCIFGGAIAALLGRLPSCSTRRLHTLIRDTSVPHLWASKASSYANTSAIFAEESLSMRVHTSHRRPLPACSHDIAIGLVRGLRTFYGFVCAWVLSHR